MLEQQIETTIGVEVKDGSTITNEELSESFGVDDMDVSSVL